MLGKENEKKRNAYDHVRIKNSLFRNNRARTEDRISWEMMVMACRSVEAEMKKNMSNNLTILL